MIMSDAVNCLRSDDNFRNKISKDIGYLIVDEYQDVNPIQEKIVRELYNLGANVAEYFKVADSRLIMSQPLQHFENMQYIRK